MDKILFNLVSSLLFCVLWLSRTLIYLPRHKASYHFISNKYLLMLNI